MKSKMKLEIIKRPTYKGFKLEDVANRVGCLDILKRPSRIENTLFYPDGRIEKLEPTND